MRTLLETHVNKALMGEAIGCAASIPVMLAVVLGVNLFIGDSQLPREIRGTTPFFAAAMGISGLFVVWLWRRMRIRLAVVERDGVRFLEVYDPANPLVFQGPFELRHGYQRLSMGKGGTQTLLVVGVFQDGEQVLRLTESWGSAWSPPEDWPAGFNLPGIGGNYSAAGTGYLVELVGLLRAPV